MGAEKNFENKVKKYLQKIGAFYFKYWGGGIYTVNGIPDLICCYKGKFIALEIKSKTGVASEIQEFQMNKIRSSGGVAMVLRPQNFEEFKKLIESMED